MIEMRVSLLGLVVVLSCIAPLATAAPRITNGVVWSDHHTQVVMSPDPYTDSKFSHELVVRRDGKQVWRADGGIYSVDILWRGSRKGAPQLVFSTLDTGNAASGTVVAIMAGSKPPVFTHPIDLAEHVVMHTRHGAPAFDQALGFGVGAFSHAQYLYDRVPTVWTSDGFKIDYPALARRGFSKADLGQRLTRMRTELATAKFADDDGYRITPHDTTDAVLPLVLSGKAQLAHNLFNQAWPDGRNGRDRVWQDVCHAIVDGSDWPDLDVHRIKDSGLIAAAAAGARAHAT
jgi:hypothetical protein